jgi:hypothetical protein
MENFEKNLVGAERLLEADLPQLRSATAKPTATQIAAVMAVASVIVTAMKQQAGWARLRLEAFRELGKFLLRTPYRKGRPPKVSTAVELPWPRCANPALLRLGLRLLTPPAVTT